MGSKPLHPRSQDRAVSAAGLYILHDEDGQQVQGVRLSDVTNAIGWDVLHEYCFRHAVVLAVVCSGTLQYE